MLCCVAIAKAVHEGGSRACRRPPVCISLQDGLSRVLILGVMGILPSCVVALWFSRFTVDSSDRTIAMIDDMHSMPEGKRNLYAIDRLAIFARTSNRSSSDVK